MSDTRLLNNPSVGAWGAHGLGIYGGSGHVVQNNYVRDTARYTGLEVGEFGTNGSNLTSGTVTGNLVLRAGGNVYNQQQAGLHIGTTNAGVTVANVTVSKNIVRDSLYYGVTFSASTGIDFEDNVIDTPGLDGIIIGTPYFPAMTGSAQRQQLVRAGIHPVG